MEVLGGRNVSRVVDVCIAGSITEKGTTQKQRIMDDNPLHSEAV